jgi:hypothetical protein
MAIEKTHVCRAAILSAVTLYQRVMLVVSLDSRGENILFLPGGIDGVDDVGSIYMCVQDGFVMHCREYPTEEELSVITYEIASVQQTHYLLFLLFFLNEGGCSRFLM